MSPASQRTILLRAALAALGCTMFTWLVQWVIEAAWGGGVAPQAALHVRSWSSLVLSACLGLLASARPTAHRAGDPVLMLVVMALLAVQFGGVLPGVHDLLADLGRTPPLMELDVLLVLLPSRLMPLAMVLAAMPGALVLRAFLARRPLERWAAIAALGCTLCLTALVVLRIQGLIGLQGSDLVVLDPDLLLACRTCWLCLVLAGVLAVTTASLTLAARRWLVGLAWLAVLTLLPDPAAKLITELYAGSGQAAELPSTVGYGPSSSFPLLDLSRQPPHFAGVPTGMPLDDLLAAEGLFDFGSDEVTFELPYGPWDFRLQRGWHLAPPAHASVAELQPIMRTLRRFGVSLWLWPGRSPQPIKGVLGPAYAQPAVAVLTFPPTAASDPIARCWELELALEGARLRDVRSGVDSSYAMPEGLQALAEAMASCEGSAVIAPHPKLAAARLFDVLDYLAGTRAEAGFRGRVALRWPSLDPAFEPEWERELVDKKDPPREAGL